MVPATIAKVFEPPEGGKPFDYVFDCTGDTTFDRPNEVRAFLQRLNPVRMANAIFITKIQRDHTAKLSYAIGLEAAKRNVKAYVRTIGPYYESSNDKPAEEKEELKPRGVRGQWWHEGLRMLAGIPK